VRRLAFSKRPRDRLVGRTTTVLDAWGDFGHAAVGGAVWIIRHPRGLLRSGQLVRVIEQRPDMLLVLHADECDQPMAGR
jgi:hypothetical protein